MFLPISIPLSNTGAHHGIINTLNKTYKVDLLSEKYVNLSSSGHNLGNINTLVNHETGLYRSKSDGSSTYIQITFLKGYIFPTGYTLKGLNAPEANGYWYCKSWYVHGIHEGDENIESRWNLLGENDTTQSTFCQTLYHNGACCDDSVGSFSLRKIPSIRGYKHLRWKLKEKFDACPSLYAFFTAGIDVYGTLSLRSTLGNCRSIRQCRRGPNNLFLIILFGNSISSP